MNLPLIDLFLIINNGFLKIYNKIDINNFNEKYFTFNGTFLIISCLIPNKL